MTNEPSPPRCPACGSRALVEGTMSQDTQWFSKGDFIRTGWKVSAYVCRQCGVLLPHLSVSDLASLRSKTAEPGDEADRGRHSCFW